MSCNYIESASPIERRLHLLRCPECRAAITADRGLAQGIERLRAEPAPGAGLARTLAAIGAAPVACPPRSRRWKAIVRGGLMPAGTITALLAAGWLYYIDLDPIVNIPTPGPLRGANAFDLFRQARAAEQDVKVMGAIETHTGLKMRMSVMNPQAVKPGQPGMINTEITKTYTPDEVAYEVRKNSQMFALLRQGLALPYRAPAIRSASTLLPYLSEDRELARAVSVEARVREAQGDRMGAVNSRLDAMQLGAMIPRGSTLLGKLVGIACEAIGRDGLWNQVDQLNAPQARAAARRMEQIVQLHVPLPDTLQEESWEMQGILMETFRNRRWRRTPMTEPEPQDPFRANMQSMRWFVRLLPYSKRRIMHDVTEFWARSIRDARLPYCARKLAAAQDRANQEQLLAQYQDPVLDIFCPVYAQAGFTDTAGCEVLDRLLMTMFALRAYHEEHHGYPETLAALVPEYLAAVPADPFVAMQPLHYRRTEGGYRLYSVGPDGRDDGGRPITNLSHLEPAWSPEKRRQARYTIGPDSQGDIVAGFNTHAGTPN